MNHRPTRAIISTEALRSNVRTIRKALDPATEIIAVVKANAYGHDLAICLPALHTEGVNSIAVATIEEARQARQLGHTGSLIVLAPALHPQYPEFVELLAEPLLSNQSSARLFNAAARSAGRHLPVHAFIDTGMARDGVQPGDALDLLEEIATLDSLKLRGFASHLATSDEHDTAYAEQQISIFDMLLAEAHHAGHRFETIHIANSGGILNIPASHYTAVRPGLSLYGYHPTHQLQSGSGLVPVLSLRTVVGNITRIPAGRSISYGCRYRTTKETLIATLPIGYADGVMRILTGQLDVLISGRHYPVVGTICMDEVMVDLGENADARIGDEAYIFGDCEITAWDLAANAGTIPYEILTSVSARVPRIASTVLCNTSAPFYFSSNEG